MTKKVKTKKNSFQFHLIGANLTRITPKQWCYKDLTARFWRLYHHDISGGGITVNKEFYQLLPEYIYIIPPNTHFSAKTTAVINQLNVHFLINPLAAETGNPFLRLKITPEINALIDSFKKFNQLQDTEMLRLTGIALTTYCLAQLPPGSLQKNFSGNFQITQLCSSLENLYQEEIDVKRMAKIAGFGSKSTFQRNFKRETGTTPYHYQLRKRYAYAAELLKNTNYTIGEICDIAGVSNQFVFSRRFKSIYGISPSKYRK